MITNEMAQKVEDFRKKHNRYPEVIVLNRDHLQEIIKSGEFWNVVTFNPVDGYPKLIMTMLYDVCDVSEMSVR